MRCAPAGHAPLRLACRLVSAPFVAKRHKRKSGYGMTVVAFVSLNRMLGVWYISPAS
jgi:hypothetical protein